MEIIFLCKWYRLPIKILKPLPQCMRVLKRGLVYFIKTCHYKTAFISSYLIRQSHRSEYGHDYSTYKHLKCRVYFSFFWNYSIWDMSYLAHLSYVFKCKQLKWAKTKIILDVLGAGHRQSKIKHLKLAARLFQKWGLAGAAAHEFAVWQWELKNLKHCFPNKKKL